MLSVAFYCYAGCRYGECHHAGCHYAECYHTGCHYVECYHTGCRYSECHHAGCHYGEYNHAVCRYGECHHAGCRGAAHLNDMISKIQNVSVPDAALLTNIRLWRERVATTTALAYSPEL
jgi:hypothetical protein